MESEPDPALICPRSGPAPGHDPGSGSVPGSSLQNAPSCPDCPLHTGGPVFLHCCRPCPLPPAPAAPVLLLTRRPCCPVPSRSRSCRLASLLSRPAAVPQPSRSRSCCPGPHPVPRSAPRPVRNKKTRTPCGALSHQKLTLKYLLFERLPRGNDAEKKAPHRLVSPPASSNPRHRRCLRLKRSFCRFPP